MTTADDAPDLIQQLKSPKPTWSHILKRVRENPAEVRHYMDPITGQTALHLAIERRSTSQSRIQAIMAMLAWYPGATMIRCKQKGYTPLDKVAASRTENEFILERDAKVAELMIRSSVKELVNSRNNLERLSPLSLHVKNMSMLQARITTGKQTTTTPAGTSLDAAGEKKLHRVSKMVLCAIAPHCSLIILSEALETLYSCNTLTIMDMISQEEKRNRHNVILDFGKQSRGRSATGHWIWEWLLDILAVLHTRMAPNRQAPFHALHLMSTIPNCPPPFLLLAMRAYPYDIRTPNPVSGNLPLHNVATWATADVNSTVRKYMCIESLSVAHEDGLAMANVAGKTPVDLDNDAGTNLLDMGGSGHDQSNSIESADSSTDDDDGDDGSNEELDDSIGVDDDDEEGEYDDGGVSEDDDGDDMD